MRCIRCIMLQVYICIYYIDVFYCSINDYKDLNVCGLTGMYYREIAKQIVAVINIYATAIQCTHMSVH